MSDWNPPRARCVTKPHRATWPKTLYAIDKTPTLFGPENTDAPFGDVLRLQQQQCPPGDQAHAG